METGNRKGDDMMETIEYRTHDREYWHEGKWDSEPDKIQWQDPTTKLPCLMVRNDLGGWCGYVGVPRNHPAYGVDYNDVAAEVHGGLTYSNKCVEEPKDKSICHIPGVGESDDVWWLGFDCIHGGDAYPTQFPGMHNGSYKDQEYVTQHVTSLAAQLAEQVTSTKIATTN